VAPFPNADAPLMEESIPSLHADCEAAFLEQGTIEHVAAFFNWPKV